MNGMITTNENYNIEEIIPKLKAYTTGNVVDKVTCTEKRVLKSREMPLRRKKWRFLTLEQSAILSSPYEREAVR